MLPKKVTARNGALNFLFGGVSTAHITSGYFSYHPG
jgi:hypothetical protein